MADNRLALDDGSLVDLLDRLLDTGVALDGNVLITLAGVDLIRLDLRLLLASVESLREPAEGSDGPHHRQHGLRGPGGTPFHVDNPHRWYEPYQPSPGNDRSGGSRPPTLPAAASPRATVTVAASAPPSRDPVAGFGHPEDPAPGVAGLVVAVVDLLRRLLERQALRRMEGGALSEQEVERLGRTLRALERQVDDLAERLRLRPPPP